MPEPENFVQVSIKLANANLAVEKVFAGLLKKYKVESLAAAILSDLAAHLESQARAFCDGIMTVGSSDLLVATMRQKAMSIISRQVFATPPGGEQPPPKGA